VKALDWLLDSDPAIRWQAIRDLTDASPVVAGEERSRVPDEGLGAAILTAQEPDGAWRREGVPAWRSTLFTLQLLRATGIDSPAPVVQAAASRLEKGLRWNDEGGWWDLRPPETGGNTFFEGEVEPCINGGVLAIGSYFGRPVEALAQRLAAEQLPDGGWNCEAPKSTRSSFHTTICVLEGLLQYERATGSSEIAAVRRRGEEYLLQRSLFRRVSTGEAAAPGFLQFAFPPSYHYDVLRALDYFRSAGSTFSPQMAEAVNVVRDKQQPDGRWLLEQTFDEALAVSPGELRGEPSRWNTLRALRVLRWFERAGD
jgi:hypothetical protein